MPKPLLWIIVAVVVLVGLGFGGRMYATKAMQNRAVSTKALGTATPAVAGIPFSRVAIEEGDRTLIGWWVRARADSGNTAPALLFFHGNRSSISDYVDLQRFLYRQGISSMVFDYSGFGASGGTASLSNAIADAAAVSAAFADSAGRTTRKTAMGAGLGATVLLQAIDSVQPRVAGIVLEGIDASAKESAVRSNRIPRFVAPLVADIADNVAAAARVRVPVLAVHSPGNARVTIEDAQRVVGAIPAPARSAVVRHWRTSAGGLLSSSRTCDWAPVLAFVRTGTLPATKVDTVNACAAEAARMAAERKTADSLLAIAAAKAAKVAPRTKTPTKAGTKAPTKAPTKRP
jgi:pimeloyl-ACP methyl ester carboxylesterase